MKLIILILSIFLSSQVFAEPASMKCGKKVSAARGSLIDLMDGKVSAEHQALVKKTADDVTVCLDSVKTSPELEAKLTELKIIWAEFKKTRENELVPAILAGKKQVASDLFNGIQADRASKVRILLAEFK